MQSNICKMYVFFITYLSFLGVKVNQKKEKRDSDNFIEIFFLFS